MAKMKSPAGDMEVQFTSVGTDKNQMLMEGKFGVWDSTIILEPSEIKKLIKMVMKPSILLLVVKLPFLRDQKK